MTEVTTKLDKWTKDHHRYFVDGERVPGVTTVLGVLHNPALVSWANKMGLQGIEVGRDVDPQATVATLCHAMIEEDIKQMLEVEHEPLDESFYSPIDLNKAYNSFFQWIDFKNEHDLKPIASDLQLVSNSYRYGGTIDLYCYLDGKATLLDIQTSYGIHDAMSHQVAAYCQLMKENNKPVDKVMILRVGKEEAGEMEIVMIDEKTLGLHFEIFENCLNIYRLKKSLKK